MKKRILSIICAIAVIASMLAVCIIPVAAASEAPWGTGISFANDGTWEGNVERITASGAFADNVGDGEPVSLTTVSEYDFGNAWQASITFERTNANNAYGYPYKLIIGDLEARFNDRKGTAQGSLSIIKGGTVVATAPCGATSGTFKGEALTLKYDSGMAYATCMGVEISANVGTIDFSAAKLTVSLQGDYVKNAVVIRKYSLEKLEASASSEPESSTPESSTPESSATDSSTPDSSESGDGSFVIDKTFIVDDWNAITSTELTNSHKSGSIASPYQAGDAIVDGAFGAGWSRVYSIASKDTYNLSGGFVFKSTLTFNNYYGNYYGEHAAMYVGDIGSGIELRIYNVSGSKAYNAYLYYAGQQLASYDLAAAPNGEYTITYENGKVSIALGGTAINWTLADSTTSTEISLAGADFSNVTIGFRIAPNYTKNITLRNWSGVYLEAFPVSDSSEPESGSDPTANPGLSIIDGSLTTEDWEGNTERLTDGRFHAYDREEKTITSKDSYNLSSGFDFASTLNFVNHFKNYYGEYASMYVGDAATGLELRIQNAKSQDLYNAYLYYGGVELASFDFTVSPNGKYTISYENGNVTVDINGTPVSWKFTDGSVSTSVGIESADFKNVKLGLRIEGNYGDGYRYWSGYTLTCKHTVTELRDAAPATCSGEGFSGDVYCAACGKFMESGAATPIDENNHVWSDWVVDAENSIQTHACTLCGASEEARYIYAEGNWNEDGTITYTVDSLTGVLNIIGSGEMANMANGQSPAFEYRDIIKSVVIGDGITYIGNRSFKGLSALESVTFGKDVLTTGYEAFYNCQKLKEVKLNEGLTELGSLAFYNTAISEITLPSTIVELNNRAFKNCANLTFIEIPNSVTYIGYEVFMNNTSLTGFKWSENVHYINSVVFSGCTALENVVIPESVWMIKSNAFTNSGVKTVNFANSDTLYTTGAIASDIFTGCTDVTVSAFSASPAEYIAKVNGFTFIAKNSTNFKYEVNTDNTVTVTGLRGESRSISIPETIDGYSVTAIGKSAFQNTSIAAVTIPATVTSIGPKAFSGTNITYIYIPENVKTVDYQAFENCANLEYVTFMGIDVELINTGAFRGCTALKGIVNFELLSTKIGKQVFANCSALSSLFIGDGVTSIDGSAFTGADTTIKCTDGSAAHTYAVNNLKSFELAAATLSLIAPKEHDMVATGIRDYMALAATYDLTDDFSTSFEEVMRDKKKPIPLSIKWGANGFVPDSVTVLVSENADMSDAVEYNATASQTLSIDTLKTGTTYYIKATAVGGENTLQSKVYTVKIKAGPRIIASNAGGFDNLRDLGGWTTTDGKTIKQGLVFRSAQFDKINATGLALLRDTLGIKTDLDFRRDDEKTAGFITISHIGEDINYANWTIGAYIGALTSQYIDDVMREFADIENYPIIFHCAQGADRTGSTALLLNGLLGVDDYSLIMDYELTYDRPRYHEGFHDFWTDIQSYEGATTQEKIYNLLRAKGLTEMELSNIYNIMMTDSAIFANTSLAKKAATDGVLTLDVILRSSADIASVTVGGNAVDYSFADGVLTVNAGDATGTGIITFGDGAVLRFEI